MRTPKETTIKYLKSIKRDLENAMKAEKKSGGEPRIGLAFDSAILKQAINIVKESEGE